jgi:hypothetical protein
VPAAPAGTAPNRGSTPLRAARGTVQPRRGQALCGANRAPGLPRAAWFDEYRPQAGRGNRSDRHRRRRRPCACRTRGTSCILPRCPKRCGSGHGQRSGTSEPARRGAMRNVRPILRSRSEYATSRFSASENSRPPARPVASVSARYVGANHERAACCCEVVPRSGEPPFLRKFTRRER